MAHTLRRFNYLAGGLWALAIGPLPLAIIYALAFTAALLTSEAAGVAALGLLIGVYAWLLSLPVWLIGIVAIGTPAWWTVRRLGGGTVHHAIAVSSVLVGGVWALVLFGFDQTAIQWTWPWVIVGFLSGGIAGYAGWRGGQPKPEVAE